MNRAQPSARALRGMAKWHEAHAEVFKDSSNDELRRMRESHLLQAARLREEADALEAAK